jgi:MEDS: MEthanogen/methylotroph, DcmR Sensory domain
MVADWPDPAGFWQAVSALLRQPAQARRPIRVFGEMVALLWEAGLIDAAVELEALWNELGVQYPFSLLCAYPAQPACASQLDALTEVCRAHTQVTGAPPEAD